MSFFNGLFPFNHVLVPLSSPASLLQKLSPGKCPENGPSFATCGRRVLSCAVLSPGPLQSAAAIFFVPLQVHRPPGKGGTLVTKCLLGFSSADPSVDSSDR